MNYLRTFISNIAGKTKVFSDLIKLKEVEEFKWEKQHQTTFDGIKGYLSKPPILMPLLKGRPPKLHLSATKESIGKELNIDFIGRYITEISDISRYQYDFANRKSVGQKSVKSPSKYWKLSILRRNIKSICHAHMG